MVLENKVLRRIFGPKIAEVRGDWRKMHNDRLHDLSCLPHWPIIRMRRGRNVARVGEIRSACKILVVKPEGRDRSENLGVDGRIILK
jgi:hypothetical protein